MAENTSIEWARATWSPWEGCTKVSPGCDHCYAEGMNRWLRKGENWGPGAARRVYSDEHWAKPLKWNAKAAAAGERWRVFPSVCDPFDNAAPAGQRARFAALILATPNLTWLLLTKRIGNAGAMLAEMFPKGVPENVWLGATIVNQEEADRDIPKLLATPAVVRFLSMEPLLGPVDLSPFIGLECRHEDAHVEPDTGAVICRQCDDTPLIEWVIVGGESGPGARPMHPQWARNLRDQCAAAGVPFLFKQWGEWTPGENVERQRGTVDTAFLFDGKWLVYPLNLATDHGHVDDEPDLYRVGKKAAGRLLDGVEHNGFPEAASRV